MQRILIVYAIVLSSLSLNAQFVDVSYVLGEKNEHTFNQIIDEMPLRVSGGIASADVNNDGFADLIYSLGDAQCLKLMINDSEGGFEEKTTDYGLNQWEFRSSSPFFFNLNNDEYIDLIVGSVDGTPPKIFRNIDGERFEFIENKEFEVMNGRNTITITSVDFDNDGYMDLFLSHWLEDFKFDHFWKNMGDESFQSVDSLFGFYAPYGLIDFSHTANFLDLNGDHFDDLLLSSDFGTSQIWMNDQGQRFVHNEDHNLVDENGMGSAIADFNNDGDYDWFVTSVFDDDGILEGNWGGTGNKLYINNGNGDFQEMSDIFGVSDASWAWGTSFGDLNNDGYQDLAVVNGWPQGSDQFKNDKLKIFMSQNGSFFYELSEDLGIVDTLQGRGVSVFDYNNDGCLDIVTSNYRGPVKLYKNECLSSNNYLMISLIESDQNYFGIGCEVELYANDIRQIRRISSSSNYLSQNPYVVHFGIHEQENIDSIRIRWNDHSMSTLYNISVNQHLKIKKPEKKSTEKLVSTLVYPNPAVNEINCIIDSPLPSDSRLIIQNSGGVTVKEVAKFQVHNGKTYFLNIDISKLNPGTYHISDKEKLIKSISIIKI